MDFLFTFKEIYRKKHMYERGVKVQTGKPVLATLFFDS